MKRARAHLLLPTLSVRILEGEGRVERGDINFHLEFGVSNGPGFLVRVYVLF